MKTHEAEALYNSKQMEREELIAISADNMKDAVMTKAQRAFVISAIDAQYEREIQRLRDNMNNNVLSDDEKKFQSEPIDEERRIAISKDAKEMNDYVQSLNSNNSVAEAVTEEQAALAEEGLRQMQLMAEIDEFMEALERFEGPEEVKEKVSNLERQRNRINRLVLSTSERAEVNEELVETVRLEWLEVVVYDRKQLVEVKLNNRIVHNERDNHYISSEDEFIGTSLDKLIQSSKSSDNMITSTYLTESANDDDGMLASVLIYLMANSKEINSEWEMDKYIVIDWARKFAINRLIGKDIKAESQDWDYMIKNESYGE